MRLSVLALATFTAFAASAAQAQTSEGPPPYDVKANYTKFEYRIPARDGKKLFTVAYVPKDESKKYPFLMVRTPYGCGPYGEDQAGHAWPSEDFLKAGYIFVCQDVRGRYMSEGQWLEMTPHKDKKNGNGDVDESSDTYDTVQWLVDHVKGNNGRVGMWGVSYPGFYAAASAVDSHPAIKAISPQAPVTDLYMGDDSYHGGAFMLAANFGFYSGFKPQVNPTTGGKNGGWGAFEFKNDDAYDYYLNAYRGGNLSSLAKSISNPLFTDAIEHERYDDYWKSRAIQKHLHGVKAAVMTVGGWFDAEDLAGPLLVDRAVREQSPGAPRTLVMGPWSHGGWLGKSGKAMGQVEFASETAQFFQKNMLLPFFEQHLKENGADAKLPAAWVFETGSNRWRRFDAWPPKEAKPKQLYLAAGGNLSWTAPKESQASFDSYVSDPAKPVPFIGYSASGVPSEFMVSDQRFAARRPDVLTYQSEVLESDVTISGPVIAKLLASTSGTDADWVVKLVDVYPPEAPAGNGRERGKDIPAPQNTLGGYQMLVRGQPLRARYRQSFEKAVASVPGQVEEIKVELPDVNHSFRRGHRIMIQVQSSWFPLIDLNPQSFVTIRDAKPADFKAATQRVYRWSGQASSLSFSTVE